MRKMYVCHLLWGGLLHGNRIQCRGAWEADIKIRIEVPIMWDGESYNGILIIVTTCSWW